jgi:peptide/nickel transport system permease protein
VECGSARSGGRTGNESLTLVNLLKRLARRLLSAGLLILIVASTALILTRLSPGDYATEIVGFDAGKETIARTRAQYGLDRPVLAQYGEWLGRAVRLDFGTSFMYRRPVSELVGRRALNTLILGVSALSLATLIGIPLGVFSGTRRGFVPGFVGSLSIVSLSVSPLLTSLFLSFAAVRIGLPVGGMTSSVVQSSWAFWLQDVARHLPLPVVALALPMAAVLERLQSRSMMETMGEPFVLATRARGVFERQIVWKDAFRTAVRPVLATWGVVVGSLLSGSFVVEIVTAWPGLGRLMYDALRARDVYLVAGCATAGAAFVSLGTLISDGLLELVDPHFTNGGSVEAS